MFVSDNADADLDGENATETPLVKGWQARRILAHGAHAEAWVMDSLNANQEQCVLKIPRSTADAAALQRERHFAVGLTHPHIVSFLGPVQTSRGEGTLWEYCAAGDALSLVQVLGPLRVSQAVTVLVPLAQALDYAHEQGVVHGDVSPGNVVFDTQGRPKLCDVGEARSISNPDRWTGTEGFSAPELDIHEYRVSLQPAADVYSLAALGWFLLTGRLPGDEARRPALKILLPEAHDEVAELLEAGLNPDPGQRPTLTEFSVACYSWALPEPLQLHALVDERTALFLPTRHELGEQHPAQRRRGGGLLAPRSNNRQRRRKQPTAHRKRRPVPRKKGMRGAHTRMGLGLGATVLGASMILSNMWAGSEPQPVPNAGADQTASEVVPSPAWDTIVDQWSERRAVALTQRDASVVGSYAVDTGAAADDDRALIDALQQQGIVYEGLSMTAQVDDASVEGASAHVLVEWTMSSYAVRSANDAADDAQRTPGSTEHVWIQSKLIDDEWRIESVTPASVDDARPQTNTAAALPNVPGQIVRKKWGRPDYETAPPLSG